MPVDALTYMSIIGGYYDEAYYRHSVCGAGVRAVG